MRNRLSGSVLTLLILVAPAAATADDLTGQQVFLCSSAQAALCTDYGDCDTFAPWDLNIPQFIEVNLKDKTLSTTKASGENRSTPIKNLQREDGQIFLQGVEAGRAFSFVINEKSGMMSVAVARDGKAVAVFGACTPMPAPAPAAK
jgi:hypothetical protein